jgi:hypothetical protein
MLVLLAVGMILIVFNISSLAVEKVVRGNFSQLFLPGIKF